MLFYPFLNYIFSYRIRIVTIQINVLGRSKTKRGIGMGLIKALAGSVGGVLADQWKEYFYCDSLSPDILLKKGEKRQSGRSSNTKAEDNIISSGSVIAVNEGQCMIIVEQGKVVDLSAEPGEYVFDSETEPSVFTGGFGKGLLESFKRIGHRFTFGGATGNDQRVYYVNIKEIVGNKYGTANPVPFRVVDRNIGLDIDTGVRCFGEYSFKIVDPIVFYTNVCGNVTDDYERIEIDPQLRSELLTALQPAFAEISAEGVRYSAVPAHADDIAVLLNQILTEEWKEQRGLEIVKFGVSSITIREEDEKLIRDAQINAINRTPDMAAATLVGAQAQAMKDAANNEGGAMIGFAGMNIAQGATGGQVSNLFNMSSNNGNNGGQTVPPQNNNQGGSAPAGQDAGAAGVWYCPKCGTQNGENFCPKCGTKKPF